MFFHLLFIHLFRPFLKYNQTSSPLPAHVSPRKMCTHAAGMISKLLRLYRRNYGLHQICNIAVYMAHSACTIHLLNLPDKNARRDIVHGLKHLEEIAESWLVARRTLNILNMLVQRWRIDLPDEAIVVLSRTEMRFSRQGSASDYMTPTSDSSPIVSQRQELPSGFHQATNGQYHVPEQNKAVPIMPTQPSMANGTSPFSNQMISPKNSKAIISPAAPAQMHPTQPAQSMSQLPPTTWNANNANTIPPIPDRGEQTSPTMLFGGEQSNIESQDWWLQDQHTLASGFENWNGITFNSEDLRMMEDNLDSAFEATEGVVDWGKFG